MFSAPTSVLVWRGLVPKHRPWTSPPVSTVFLLLPMFLFIGGLGTPGARGMWGRIAQNSWAREGRLKLNRSLNLGLDDVGTAMGPREPLIQQLFLDQYVPASILHPHWFKLLSILPYRGPGVSERKVVRERCGTNMRAGGTSSTKQCPAPRG